MPLKIELRPHEQVIINGALVTIDSSVRVRLIVHNHAEVLPGKFALSPERATTPVRRLYLAVQTAYLAGPDDGNSADLHADADRQFARLLEWTQGTNVHAPLLEACNLFRDGATFRALRSLRALVEQEAEVLAKAGQPIMPAFASGISRPDIADAT